MIVLQVLPVSLVLFVFTLYLDPTIARRDTGNSRIKIQWRQTKQGTPAIVGSTYRVKTNKTRDTGMFLVLFVFTVSWAYYCQCPLFCLSSLCILILLLPVFLVLFVFTKQGTLAIVGSRYRVKTNKTRDTGNSRIKIQSEDKQNKGHWH
jgi:cell division protein FtsW (lipid II flippase)